MNASETPNVRWIAPWRPVRDEERDGLKRELAREIGPRHVLHGRAVTAIARRDDNDDVLFVLADEPSACAVVHLTWRGRVETDPRWPATTLFASIEQWASECMLRDGADSASS